MKEITYCQAYSTMCAGYFKVLVGLRKEAKILVPESCFDNEAVRYEHRFAPFNNLLTPPSMPYSQYADIYNHTADTKLVDLYGSAARDFGRARQIFESAATFGGSPMAPNLDTLIAVTKKNFVASAILAKDSGRKVEFEFETHQTFPVIKVS